MNRIIASLFGALFILVLIVTISLQYKNNQTVLGASTERAQIGSGVTNQSSTYKELTGIAVWDASLDTVTSVASDKFQVGEAITATNGNYIKNLVIGQFSSVLSENTLLRVDTATFQALGGNPEITSSIQIQVHN